MPPAEDDSYVSALNAMLEQQWEFYEELIQHQQDNFKSFVKLITDGTNKKLDSFLNDVQDAKYSLQETWDASEDKVRHMLRKKLGLDCDSIQIEWTHSRSI